MREIVFALEFKGSAAPVAGADGKLAAKTTATSQVWRAVLKDDGVQGSIEPSGGAGATFESEVQIVGDGKFLESGTIAYGAAGRLHFKTIGQGVLGASPTEGLQRGAVIWEVTRGEGRLAGAQGIITSNFTVGAQGEVVDDHVVRLFLP